MQFHFKNFKKRFSAFKFSPKLWDKPARTALGPFLRLWSTQTFSALGSSMTSFALVIWAYEQSGSALSTALLSICSYAPYVLLSIFAGALSDRWNKKATMLICDAAAALTTVGVLVLLSTDALCVWHLYVLNALNGLMNTVQQPASEVAVTLLTPKAHYQRTSGLRSFSNSLNSVLTGVFATALLAFGGMYAVIAFDLTTFAVAFLTLLFGIRIPQTEAESKRAPMLENVRAGLQFLKANRGILDLILFLAAINFVASMYNAALPAMVLSVPQGGETALGLIDTCAGLAMVIGSVIVSLLPAPKSRTRVICNALLVSMSMENFLLALGHSMPVWCVGAVLGWLPIPLMNANLDVLFRTHIPVEMQGRVYAARNSLQFFTIPLGYLLGGALVDTVFEPFMAAQTPESLFCCLFGTGKGSGAAFLFLVLGFLGVAVCLCFRRSKPIRGLEANDKD